MGHRLSVFTDLLRQPHLGHVAEMGQISRARHVRREVHAHRSDSVSGNHHMSVHQDQAEPVQLYDRIQSVSERRTDARDKVGGTV